ncbi:MAG TPA: hypothetical protein VIV60_31600, partial [Polyangiaceae bacterium]
RELSVLTALSDRLGQLRKTPSLSPELQERLFNAANPKRQSTPPLVSRRWVLTAMGGWAAAACLGVGWALRESHSGKRESAAPVEFPRMVNDVLRAYDSARGSELPAPRTRSELEAALGTRVPILENSELELLSSWLTHIVGQPSVALAYRYRAQLVVQFVISAALFLRPAAVRVAVSRGGAYVAETQGRAIVGRSQGNVGSLWVGELALESLERLSRTSS